ncbi:hypothetical protein H5410_021153 [Solanum commersonii]|uniref:F-box associated beta-propeller type 3 domain-containing protein n=1 Tax=Solanum commersonii TaxID=4109 RepID=A0A9J5ZDF1_SOLCO|nr:hypothetical protein H5410_021153 [Solanum commersonii]
MASGQVFIAFQVSKSDFVNIHTCRSMSRLSGKKFVLHESESVFGIAEQTEDEKYSAPFLQITKFNDIYVQGFSYSPLDYVNGLFCLWGLLSTRPATIFNPNTREPSVCIDGVIYVFNDRAIAAIDVKAEKSETFALWNAPHLLMYYYELIEVKGKLEVIAYKKWVSGYVDLWILEQAPIRKWERHIIRIPSTWNNILRLQSSNYNLQITSLCKFSNGDILFIVNLNPGVLYLCYDVTRKSWKELKIKGRPKERLGITVGYGTNHELVGRWEKLTSENIFHTSSLGWGLASSIFYKYNPVKTYFMSTIKMSLKLNPRGKLQNRLLAQRYCRTQC